MTTNTKNAVTLDQLREVNAKMKAAHQKNQRSDGMIEVPFEAGISIVMNAIAVTLSEPLFANWRAGDPNRHIIMLAACRVGYPGLTSHPERLEMLPGQWAKANNKVEEFRAEKRKFGIGGAP